MLEKPNSTDTIMTELAIIKKEIQEIKALLAGNKISNENQEIEENQEREAIQEREENQERKMIQEIEFLKEEYKKKREEMLETHEKEKEALQNQINSLNEEKNSLYSQINDLNNEKNQLHNQINGLNGENNDLHNQVNSLNGEKNDLYNQVNNQNDRIDALQGQVGQLEEEKRSYQHQNNALTEQKQHLESKVTYYEATFGEMLQTFRLYQSLNESIREDLKNVLNDANVVNFITTGTQWDNIESLWDYIHYKLDDHQKEEIDTLMKIFNYFFNTYNCCFKLYERDAVTVGTEYDTDFYTRDNSSNVYGTITEVRLLGYKNKRTNKLVRKSIVRI